VVHSPKLDNPTAARIREFLVQAHEDAPEVLRPLRISAYREPTAELLSACDSVTGVAKAANESGQ
jgi:hypothetical protein